MCVNCLSSSLFRLPSLKSMKFRYTDSAKKSECLLSGKIIQNCVKLAKQILPKGRGYTKYCKSFLGEYMHVY